MALRNRPEGPSEPSSGDPSANRSRNRRTAIVLLIAALPVILGLYLLALYWSRPAEHGQQVRLDEFLTMVREGRVDDAVVLDSDNRVIGESSRGPFWVSYGTRESTYARVLQSLEDGGVPTTLRQQWGKGLIMPLTALLPALLIVDGIILAFLLVRGGGNDGGMFGFGRASAKRAGGESRITFKDVAGLDEAVEELAEVRDYLANPDRFLRMGARVPSGILLTGPPGCGKTLLARGVAGEAGVPFFSISGSNFVEMFVGVGAARIRDLFKTAMENAPCIVFIDELDAVGRGRTSSAVGGQDERETTLNQLLVSLDGFDATTGIVVLAATNRPDVLDEALLRPGRFDRRIAIDRPDRKGRLGILQIHARGKPLADDVDLEMLARRTPGFSGADLANVVNEAALLAARYDRDQITQAEALQAIERLVAGPERKSRVMDPSDRRIHAYHEAGHAVVSAAVTGADMAHKVSIVSRGHAGGMTWFTPAEDVMVASRSQLTDRLAVLLAGRAAEELLTGEPTSSAEDDLQRASGLAWKMVADLGMSEGLGPLSLKGLTGATDLPARVSDHLGSAIDEEVRKLLITARDRARVLLEEHRPTWEVLAGRLLDEETIEGPDLELLLEPVRSPRQDPADVS